MADPARVMFLFWGRRGSLTKIAHDMHAAALAMPDIAPVLSISRQSENFADCAAFGPTVHPVDTFARTAGAVGGLWRLPDIARALRRRLEQDRIEAVVNLMPHVWTPFMTSAVHAAGARFATIIHDASSHPGDRTALLNSIFAREARRADVVFTLSGAVTRQIGAAGWLPPQKIVTLFHPDLDYSSGIAPGEHGGPLRVLFLGRIMRYKGLGLLVEALELLRARGQEVRLGVYGEGSLAPYEARLQALGATTINRWLSDAEIAEAFSRHDVVALSHTEASQSGVAAAAFGAGLPVAATPVGGLTEQVRDGVNGVLAREVSAAALADAIGRLAASPQLLARLRANIASGGGEHSMERFVRALVDGVLPGRISR